MGSSATPEALVLRWEEVVRDASLRDLPYKIELNAWGKIEMSPAKVRHSRVQGYIALELGRQLTGGEILPECPVLTAIGVRVPDVAWASEAFMRLHGSAGVLPRAPEICVEVVSESNTKAEIDEKIQAYLAAGAQEVWIATEAGELHYFDAAGEKVATRFGVTLSLPKP
jgi:Uma2 family endonuclease